MAARHLAYWQLGPFTREVPMRATMLLSLLAALLLAPLSAQGAGKAAGKKRPAAAAPAKADDKATAPSTPAPATAGPAGAPTGDVAVGPRGPTRIDFDDRLIQGQTNKSGAVYLFDRKELSVRSMVRQRTSFRDQIVKDILTE